ncbi:Formate--tetrahydrofolate ligase [Trichinella spiralis]|uniref:Formate--tetrahydrofolate ligase n=1 Tax=Trichinella spiralis TaxID=6334 RepID=A0ABR3KYK7_TRISP
MPVASIMQKAAGPMEDVHRTDKPQKNQRKIARMLHGCIACFMVAVLSKRYDYAKKTEEGSCPNCAVDLSRSFTSDSDVDRNG